MKRIFQICLAGFIGVSLLAGATGSAFAQTPTTEELSAQIQSLLKVLTELQAQVQQLQQGGSTGVHPTLAPTISPSMIEIPEDRCLVFDQNLRIGDQGKKVQALQKALIFEGFKIAEREMNSGAFGESTAAAVVGFQEKYSQEILAPFSLQRGTGFVGASTRAKLNALYGCVSGKPLPTDALKPAITIISPAHNEEIKAGSSYRIQWKSSGVNSVNIDMREPAGGTADTITIAKNIPAGLGYYDWNLYAPLGQQKGGKGTTYLLYVRDASQSASFSWREIRIFPKEPMESPFPDSPVPDTGSAGPAPNIVYPANGQILNYGYPHGYMFKVEEVAGASGYLFQFFQKGSLIYDNQRDDGRLSPDGEFAVWTDNPFYDDFKEGNVDVRVQALVNGIWSKARTITITLVRPGATVAPASVTVLSPNGGETWTAGSPIQMEIRWLSGREIPGFNVDLYKAGVFQQNVGIRNVNAQISQDGNITKHLTYWPIPSTVPAGNDYTIRISNASNEKIFDESDRYFSIVSSQTITSCILGDVNMDGVITIVDSQFIAQYVAGNRTFTDDQKKRADVNGDGVITSADAEYVASYLVGAAVMPPCSKPSITVLSPNGGEILEEGKTHLIKWVSQGVKSVHLSYAIGGKGYELADVEANKGYYAWVIPAGFVETFAQGFGGGVNATKNNISVMVSSNDAGLTSVYDKSDSAFSITKEYAKGTFHLLWNRLPEQLKVASAGAELASLNVSALYEDIVLDDIRVDFDGSKDAFRAIDDLKNVYLMIGDTKVGSGSSMLGDTNNHWTSSYRLTEGKTVAVRVIGDIASTAVDEDAEADAIRVNITVRGTGARSGASIESNKATGQSIILVPGDRSLVVVYPNGGEKLEQSKTYQIRWNSTGAVGPVDIYLMKGNVALYTLAFQTANDGVFDWTIGKDALGMAIAPGEYRVKILETKDQQIADQSDNIFMVADMTAPVRSEGKPSGTLVAGTKTAMLSLSTNETAKCLYSSKPGMPYNPLSGGVMDQVNAAGTQHEGGYISGLSEGKTYTYYVRCRDSAGNTNDSDYVISFKVAGVDVSSVMKFAINTASPTGALIPGQSTLLGVFDVRNTGSSDVTFKNANGNSLTIAISQSVQQEDGNLEAMTLKNGDGMTLDTAMAELGASPTTVTFDFANESFVVPGGSTKTLYVYGDTREFFSRGDAIQLWLDSSDADSINWGLDGVGNYGHADIIFRGDLFAGALIKQ